jgi:hypothetical protein
VLEPHKNGEKSRPQNLEMSDRDWHQLSNTFFYIHDSSGTGVGGLAIPDSSKIFWSLSETLEILEHHSGCDTALFTSAPITTGGKGESVSCDSAAYED